jgi:putative transcriptional regulator
LSNGQLSSSQGKIFIGYCGWDTGELQAEIEEGSWEISDFPLSEVFK